MHFIQKKEFQPFSSYPATIVRRYYKSKATSSRIILYP